MKLSVKIWIAVSTLCIAGCPDFGLEGREFLCSTDTECTGNERCIDNVCTIAPDSSATDASATDASVTDASVVDAAADATPDAPQEICDNGLDDDSDSLVDCQDPDCGLASCDDQNPCTDDICEQVGSCRNEPLMGAFSCGTGCLCVAGTPTETACEDRVDNDADGLRDCLDADCGACPGALMCCIDGSCQLSC